MEKVTERYELNKQLAQMLNHNHRLSRWFALPL